MNGTIVFLTITFAIICGYYMSVAIGFLMMGRHKVPKYVIAIWLVVYIIVLIVNKEYILNNPYQNYLIF